MEGVGRGRGATLPAWLAQQQQQQQGPGHAHGDAQAAGPSDAQLEQRYGDALSGVDEGVQRSLMEQQEQEVREAVRWAGSWVTVAPDTHGVPWL